MNGRTININLLARVASIAWTMVMLVSCTNSTGMVLKNKTDTNTGHADTATDTDTGDTESSVRNRSPLGFSPASIADWSSAFPLINLMKQSRVWYDWDNEASSDFDVDNNGWVRSLAAGQTAGTVFLANVQMPQIYDRAIVTYDGTGILEYGWSAAKVEEESAPGRDVITLSVGNHLLKVTQTAPDDYIRNIAIVPEPLEGNHTNGEIFNPAWLDRIKGASTFRFGDWLEVTTSQQEQWEDRPGMAARTWSNNGVPFEAMIDLANRMNIDPWIQIPHLATDDYIRRLAQLIADTLDPSLVVYVEDSHKPWSSSYPAYQYSDESGKARWGAIDDAFAHWHGMRTASICDIFKQEVFTENPQRVNCVLTVPVESPEQINAMTHCSYWTDEVSGRLPCYQHGIDSIAISAFFDGCLQDDLHMETITSWFDQSDGGTTMAMEQLSDGRHLNCDRDIASRAQQFAYFASLAKELNINLIAFEGGQQISAVETPWQEEPAVIDFHIGLNRHEQMAQRYRELLGAWKNANGGLFIHLNDIAFPGKYGSWGALEYVTQQSSPKWEALMEFKSTPCWWDGC